MLQIITAALFLLAPGAPAVAQVPASQVWAEAANTAQTNSETKFKLLMVTGVLAYDKNGDKEIDGRDWAKMSDAERHGVCVWACQTSYVGAASIAGHAFSDDEVSRVGKQEAARMYPIALKFYKGKGHAKHTIFDVMSIYGTQITDN